MAETGYQLRYTAQAVKDIKSLDPVVKKRLGATLERYRTDPFKYAVKLQKSAMVGQYRFRIGHYRVIFDRHGQALIILRVMHRREVYQR